MDVFKKKKRSEIMARIKGRDTGPELIVRSTVHKMGYRFRLHSPHLPGSPDLVLPKHKKVIFVHGCFWHGHKGCKRSQRPTSNIAFWNKKINGNMERDKKILQMLRRHGWKSLVVWQCQTRNQTILEAKLSHFMKEGGRGHNGRER